MIFIIDVTGSHAVSASWLRKILLIVSILTRTRDLISCVIKAVNTRTRKTPGEKL